MERLELIKQIIPTLNFKFPYSAEEYNKCLYLENYHSHKDFSNQSTPDCAEPLENYVKEVLKYGTKCLYSMEHGSQGNQFLCYDLAEQNGLKYIHCAEGYWVKNRHEKDRTNCHIWIGAKNKTGREDVNYALSMANIDGYYYKPRLDIELLKQIPKDNVIITTACIAGWQYENAEDIWIDLHKYFGNNFYLEVQANNTEKQKELNKKILRIAKENNIQIIAGCDTHYITIDTQKKREQILKYKNVHYPEEEGWYMDYPSTEKLIKRFKQQGILSEEEIFRAIMNTNVFASDEIEEIKLDRSFKIPSVYKGYTYKQKVKKYHNLLNKAYSNDPIKSKEKENGIRYEASQVTESGTTDYFLTTNKILDLAIHKYGGILTTTGRGSSASFVTNKLLGITTIDRFNADVPLFAPRFLTKERVLSGQMPDIDNNIVAQEPFVQASRELLGEHGCYPLMALSNLKEKAAWNLYSGANDVPIEDTREISKGIDAYNKKLKYADEEDKEFIHVEDFISEKYLDLYKKSKDYQDITIGIIQHPCAYLIFDGDIRREIGLITAVSESSGEKHLCACAEGKYLDEFGYVKQDFLIVDSVGLTNEFFASIGEKVPSCDKLKQMIKDDKPTWDIYEKGITCCINQCEKEATTNRCKAYKPKNITELAMFIAAIRPGFKSLLPNYIKRLPYSTGEPKIDEVLKNTNHYMIFQESIMLVLSYLGLPMDETYGVIKAISKKKYQKHPEKLKELKDKLKQGWIKQIGNIDNFDKIWNVIEDASRYSFNASHALEMGFDSVYQAWFKAHYTAKFYEVSINHYQKKNNKDKIDALTKEAIKFFGYTLGSYKFGTDNRRVIVDEKNKVIYPNLSSIKGMGEKVSQALYEYGLKHFNTFIDVLANMPSEVNKTIVKKLIRIDYFSEYGKVNKLLSIYKYFELLYGKKEISKEKLKNNNIDIELALKYGHETVKKINQLDTRKLLNELIDLIKDVDCTPIETIQNEISVLGMSNTYDENNDKREYVVQDIDIKKSLVNMNLYEIYSGKVRELKIWRKSFDRNCFNQCDLLYINSIKKENKREASGEKDPKTGKNIWVKVPDKYEFWLTDYYVESSFVEDGE